jgi:C4-dicarboxylate-specific signal transduction histidine kinase
MSEPHHILSSDGRAITSPSARLTRVETDLANLRNAHSQTWEELEKLRLVVMPMVTTLSTLTVLSERADRDRHRILEGLERLSERLSPIVATVAAQGIIANEHISDCERDRRAATELATERHDENQAALRRMDNRTKRVERIYYFIFAGMAILGFMSSDLGQKIFHYLTPAVR